MTLTMKEHRHLVKLLATYKYKGKYHLLFPYADLNLRQFWERPVQPDNLKTFKWSLEQMRGLASAVNTIHNYEVVPKVFPNLGQTRLSKLSDLAGQGSCLLYGRHGDLKPENILWTKDDVQSDSSTDELENLGLLRITDFGLARFHRLESRSRVDPKTVAGTATYVPPEVIMDKPISRAYDIWSLACVYLEFITWLVVGVEALDHFTEMRCMMGVNGVVDDSFFEMSPKGVAVRGNVKNWIMDLHAAARCSEFIHDLLDLITEQTLVVDPEERIAAETLTDKLSEMLIKAKVDSDYLVQPKPWAIRIHEMETKPYTLEVTSENVLGWPQASNSGERILNSKSVAYEKSIRTQPRGLRKRSHRSNSYARLPDRKRLACESAVRPVV
jgi:serine/threonine protein kinase